MSENNRHSATTDNDATYDHIVKYTGLFGGVQGISLLINIIRNKVTAQFLGSAGIGLINVYNKTIGLIGQATNLGISFSAVKHIAELSETTDATQRDTLIDTVRMWSLMTAALGILVGTLLSPWISWWAFKNYDYTLTFSIISLIVAMTTITAGEIAILKGLKQLKKVAIISIFAALVTLVTCIPFYYCWGIGGVVGALVASNAAILGIHLYYTSQVAPWRKSIATFNSIRQGVPMARLGIAYILAGVITQGADFFISTFILNHGSLGEVGLYNTGFLLVTYVGTILFTSIEADFFPRLSTLTNDIKRMNKAINRQIEMCVLLITPCLILEVIAMPLIVRMLYTAQFMQAVPMATYAIFYLFFKSMTLPVAYLALAKGDSRTFFIAELLYGLFVSITVPLGFMKYGLPGAGFALSLANLFDLVMIYTFYGAKYGFRLTLQPLKMYVTQLLLLGGCVYASTIPDLRIRWTLYILTLASAVLLSLHQLYQKTNLIPQLQRR